MFSLSAGVVILDAKLEIKSAIDEIRQAMRDLRESVVKAVQRRHQAEAALASLVERQSDLQKSLEIARQLQKDALAAEFTEALKSGSREIEDARRLCNEMEVQAHVAQESQSSEEARLQTLVISLQERLVGTLASSAGATEGGVADSLWESAQNKTQTLLSRAQIVTNPLSEAHEENANQALAELEAKLAGKPAPAQIPEMKAYSQGKYGYSKAYDRPKSTLSDEIDAIETESLAASEPASEVRDLPEAQTPPVATPPLGETADSRIKTNARGSDRASSFSAFSAVSVLIKGETPQMERVKVAAIGTGGIFRGAHLPCYPDIPKAKMTAFCDPDPAAQKAVMKQFEALTMARIEKVEKDIDEVDRLKRDLDEVRVYSDISEIIAEVKPDLVDICTLPMLHTPLAIQALEAGIHVMCEKPVSRSWLESQRLIEAVKRTGKFYQHNENWLFDPDYYTVKKLVDSGAIGELVMMYLTQAHGGPEGNHRFWNSDFGGGGSLLDNGIHAIGAVWFITGLHRKPTMVKAAEPFGMTIRMPDRIIDGRYQKVTVDDDAHILIRFEDEKTGAWSTAHVEGSWSHQDSPDTCYIGSTGRIEMKNIEGKRYAAVIDSYGNEARKIQVSGMTWSHWPSSFYGEIQNMVMCVINNEQSIMTAEFGADCSAIVGASYLSQKDGKRAVSTEEFRQFARSIAAKYPNDPKAADDALVDALLSAVRK